MRVNNRGADGGQREEQHADQSDEAHERAIQRMVHAGVKPVTSVQYLLELQRDWARQETYGPVTDLMKRYGGGYGIGIQYAHKMLSH